MEKYLYLIEFNNLYKIGISKNPEKRLKQMTLGPMAKIIHKKQFPHVHKIEKSLHNFFDKKQISSEWFKLNPDDVQYIIDFDIAEYIELNQLYS